MEPQYATKADLEASELRLLERIEKTETTLLKEFRKRAVRFEAIVKVNEASVVGFNARLNSLEERVNDLESSEN
jgi:hypothetical protein